MSPGRRWAPAAILALGCISTMGVSLQRTLPLRESLSRAVPARMVGLTGADREISPAERRVAGVSDYLFRVYSDATGPALSVYIGYYASQRRGKTIHSPKNCLPGAGWEALESRQVAIHTPAGEVPANRYILKRGAQVQLVLYWYQGRGRVVADEYAVKWFLLRDAAVRHRSDEALVRVMVPVTGSAEQADSLARSFAGRLVGAVKQALPAG